MKREQILLIATLVLLGLMVWSTLGEEQSKRARQNVLRLNLDEMGSLDPVVELSADVTDRDPFRQPRDIEPLPPLQLDTPPLDSLAVLLPPPMPDSGPSFWSRHLMLVPKAPPGGIGDLVDLSSFGENANAGSATSDQAADVSEEGDYTTVYDSIRINAFSNPRWGRILGEDRWDKQRGDSLRFQEYDPKTGEPRFQATTLEGDQYESFQFAKTLRNDLELRVRALNPSAGAIEERRALIRWLLEQGIQEPVAFEHAERIALEGVKLAKDDLKSWLFLGEVWERTFRYDQAFGLYAHLVGEQLPQVNSDLSSANQQIAALDIPFGHFKNRAAPMVRMAALLQKFELLQQSRALLERAVAMNDVDPAAPLALGLLLLRLEDPAAALGHLQQADGRHTSRSSVAALENRVAIGQVQLQLGNWQAAETAFQQAREAAANEPGVAQEAWAGQIAAIYLSGDFQGAFQEANRAIEEIGADRKLLYLRGIASAADGEPAADVIRDLRASAAASDLDAAPAFAALAFWMDVLGEEDLAAEALERALELSPELPYAIYLRARWARLAENTSSAHDDLRNLIGQWPRFGAALAELGWLLSGESRFERAEVALRRAEVEAPDVAGIALRRGVNLLQKGDVENAQAALNRSLRLQADLHAARNARAWASYLDGDLDSARAEYVELMDLLRQNEQDPQFDYAKVWEERINFHDQLRLWTDPFDGDLFRAEWDPQTLARAGVEPEITDGQLRMRGTHRGEGETRVFRQVRSSDFVRYAADLTVGEEHQGDAGIYLALVNRKHQATWITEIYRNRDQRLVVHSRRAAKDDGPQITTTTLAAGTPFRVDFSLDREQEPPFLMVTVNGVEVFSGPTNALTSSSGNVSIGAFVRTRRSGAISAALDNVELVFTLRQ